MIRIYRCYVIICLFIGILIVYITEFIEIHDTFDIPTAESDHFDDVDVPFIRTMIDHQNNSHIVTCDPFHFRYTTKLLSELQHFRDQIIPKTTFDIDAQESIMENILITIRSFYSAVSLHEYIRIKVINSTLFLRVFDHDIYAVHNRIPFKIDRLKFLDTFSNLQYSDMITSYFWSLVQRYGAYIDRTDVMIQIYDDIHSQHQYDWLRDPIPILLSDSNQNRSDHRLLLHSVSRGLAMIHQPIMPYQGRAYEKLQKLKIDSDPQIRDLFDWRSKPLNLCFFRGENQGFHREEFQSLHFWNRTFDFKFVVKNARDDTYFVGIEDQIKYKFLLNIDGYSVRDSFVYNLEFGAVILTLNGTGNHEFWIDDLEDGVHHILFNDLPHLIDLMTDFTFIVEQYELNGVRGGEVEREYMRLYDIAEAAKQFAADYLNRDAVDCFTVNLIKIYNHYLYDIGSWALDPRKDQMVELQQIMRYKEMESRRGEVEAMVTAMVNLEERKQINFKPQSDDDAFSNLNDDEIIPISYRLVLTHFVGEPLFERFYVFIASFHRHVVEQDVRHRFHYKVVVFTDFNDNEFYRELHSISSYFTFMELVDIRSMKDRVRPQYANIDFMNKRFFEYKAYLDIVEFDVDSVMISDSTDVVFRDNVFNLMDQIRVNPDIDKLQYHFHPQPIKRNIVNQSDNEYFAFFMEQKGYRIIDSKPNMNWIQQCFGRKVMIEEFGNCSISCAGTMLGTIKAMKLYLEILIKLWIERHLVNLETAGWDQCLKLPSDQGLHNVVLHRGLLNEVGVHTFAIPNEHQWIMQMTLMVEGVDWTDQEILDFASRSCVVHQYKRHEYMTRVAMTAFNYSQFQQMR